MEKKTSGIVRNPKFIKLIHVFTFLDAPTLETHILQIARIHKTITNQRNVFGA
jgi:hypothetical protein